MSSVSSPWPAGCRGALSLTFDDGNETQLQRAIPVMEERGLRGTFYMSPRGDNWREALEPWRSASDAGHEIGNHSLSHICSRGFSDNPQARGLEMMTLDDIEDDVVEAERRLQEVFPTPDRSFCYPCFQNHVGEGLTRQSYTPVIAKHFSAGRGLGEVPNHPATCDLHYVWSWMIRGNTGMELVGMAEQAADRGRWGIMTFHGISVGHLPVAETDFTELCDHLRIAGHIWVAPVREVALAIREWRKATTRTGGGARHDAPTDRTPEDSTGGRGGGTRVGEGTTRTGARHGAPTDRTRPKVRAREPRIWPAWTGPAGIVLDRDGRLPTRRAP